MTINLDQYTNTLNVTDTATNADLNVTTKGTGSVNLNNGNGIQFKVADTLGSVATANYVKVQGRASGGPPFITVDGTDANTSLGISCKGAAFLQFYTNSTALEQFRISHTASAVNYIQLTGSATGGATFMSSAGSDTNIPLSVASKGTGILYLGGGQTRIASNGSNSLIVGGPSGAVNYVAINSSATGITPSFLARGGDANVGLTFGAFNDANIDFYASGDPNSGTGRLQLRVAPTTSAVNYVQVTGAATGGQTLITAQGSDASIDLGIKAKGSYDTYVGNANGWGLRARGTSSAGNYFQIAGVNAGSAPVLSVIGGDTNIDLTLTPKGTGNVRFGTYTGTILTPTGYVEIKDSGGTVRRLLVG